MLFLPALIIWLGHLYSQRNEQLAHGGDDDPTDASRLSMAQAALLNTHGGQIQSQYLPAQLPYARAPQPTELNGPMRYDIPFILPTQAPQGVAQSQMLQTRVHTVANGGGGGLLGGSRRVAADEVGRIPSSTNQLPFHPLTVGTQRSGLSIGAVNDRNANTTSVMDFQKFVGNTIANTATGSNLEHLMDFGVPLRNSDVFSKSNASSSARSVKDSSMPLSPLQLQYPTSNAGDGGSLCDLSIVEQLALLRQQQIRIQQQQQEAEKLLMQPRTPSLGLDAFSQLQAQTLLRSPAHQSTTPTAPSLDAFAKLRERVLAQQHLDQYVHQQQQSSPQLQSQMQQQAMQRSNDVGVIGTSPSVSPSLVSSGRLVQSQRIGDLRHHILAHNQQQSVSNGRSTNPGGQLLPTQRVDRLQQQHDIPKHSHIFASPRSPENHHLSVRSRRLEDEEGSGSDATPFVSPALTYASRTPSTLSPSTPMFETFTPPQQSSASIPNSGSSSVAAHHGSVNPKGKHPIEGRRAVEVSVPSPGGTSSPNTGVHGRQHGENAHR